jgi:ATP-binding cassette subfamily C protein
VDLFSLYQACSTIGKEQGLSFKKPSQNIQDLELEAQIASLCVQSEIRFRKVELKGEWWKKNSGPLLGFHGKEQVPVALLNSSDYSYRMQKQAVNADTAKQIGEYAYVFYPPLPSKTALPRLKKHGKDLSQLIIYSSTAAIFALFPLLAILILFDVVIPDASISLIGQIAIGLVVAALGTSLFLYFRSLKLVKIEGSLSHKVQVGIWDRLVRLPVAFFQKFSSGNLILRILSTENIRSIASGNTSRVLTTSTFLLFYLIAMFVLAPLLALIGASFAVLSLLITYLSVKKLIELENQILVFQEKIVGFLFQVVKAVAKLRTAGAERGIFSNWASDFSKKKRYELKKQNIRSLINIFNYLMPLLGIACILTLVIETRRVYSVGEFIAFMTGYILFSMQLAELNTKWMEMVPIAPLWNHTRAILQETPEDQKHRGAPGPLLGEISADKVTFRKDLNGPNILEDVSFKICPQEFVGIVGRSGAGKSTLIRHLIGFETPTSGTISYDGKDLSRLNHQSVRKQLGLVMQDSEIIQGTILENVTCGQRYSDEEIEMALQISGLEEELKEFPMGLFTLLPMGVETLSGGQKQKILLARALLPKPKVLLFDEAMSALDNLSQLKLMERLSKLDVTKVIVAHRLNTVKNADRIYVLEKGKLAQEGRYEELANQPGPFSDMLHAP